MKKIFGSVSLIVLLASCTSSPVPVAVSGKLSQGWQTGFASGYKASVSGSLMLVPAQRDVIAIDIESGEVAWKYESPTKKLWNCVSCQPFGDGFLAYFESGAGSLLVELSREGVETKAHENERVSSRPAIFGPRFWQVQSNLAYSNVSQFKIEPSFPVVEANDRAVFIVTQTNFIRAYDKYGKALWYAQMKALTQDIKLEGDRLYVHTDKGLACFNAGDGKFLWQMECVVSIKPKIFGKNIIMATDKSILEIDGSGAIQRSLPLDNVLSLELAPDGFAVVASSKLLTFDSAFGKIEEIAVSDGIHQALPVPGGIVTNGTLGQVFYKLAKP
jgi:outer membrane protein assembly factor BamB